VFGVDRLTLLGGDMRDFVFAALALIVVALLVAMIVDSGTAAEVRIGEGQIMEKVYTPSSTRVGTGTSFDMNGNPSTIVPVDDEPERWTIIVSFKGKTFSRRVSSSSGRNSSGAKSATCLKSKDE
jgi:hypothetical protein